MNKKYLFKLVWFFICLQSVIVSASEPTVENGNIDSDQVVYRWSAKFDPYVKPYLSEDGRLFIKGSINEGKENFYEFNTLEPVFDEPITDLQKKINSLVKQENFSTPDEIEHSRLMLKNGNVGIRRSTNARGHCYHPFVNHISLGNPNPDIWIGTVYYFFWKKDKSYTISEDEKCWDIIGIFGDEYTARFDSLNFYGFVNLPDDTIVAIAHNGLVLRLTQDFEIHSEYLNKRLFIVKRTTDNWDDPTLPTHCDRDELDTLQARADCLEEKLLKKTLGED